MPDVRVKFEPVGEEISGKRLVLVADSVISGGTIHAIVNLLREAGAAEVHVRVASPPMEWPCYFGVDTGVREELLAADLDISQIEDYLGCDSLGYLDLDQVVAATGLPASTLCFACVTGSYPVDIPISHVGEERAAAVTQV
jgi:amidophosphoribosyltransferase